LNIYLDIDGVILTKQGKLASGADIFLCKLIENEDNICYWLTTRCKGDTRPVLNALQPLLDQKTSKLVECVKPTNWNTLKTEAIDFNKPFLWFDDILMYSEEQVLRKNCVLGCFVRIDIRSNPYQLRDIKVI
jgi:hypothetical protein